MEHSEEAQVEEILRQATARSGNTRFIRIIIAAAIIAIVGFVVLKVIPEVQDSRTYQHALELEEQGDFATAHSIYKQLGSYKDSAQRSRDTLDMAHEAAYEEAEALLEAGEFDAAEKIYRELGNYKGARARLKSMDKFRAEAAVSEEPADAVE